MIEIGKRNDGTIIEIPEKMISCDGCLKKGICEILQGASGCVFEPTSEAFEKQIRFVGLDNFLPATRNRK